MPRRERKVVTVLFCDLVGFTSQAAVLDPEDVEAILHPYHERVRSELERHGGTVEKFIGDAVMALFGAPTAHEDDPERAVRAALAIRDFGLEERLELRIGVTTGETLVSLDANPSGGEGMASGDVVNTSARLQTAAPVNGILVDETTYRATRAAVDYDEAPPVEAKGKSEPILVWGATGARSRFGVDVAHHARAELVGRERELGVLHDAFERARDERTPQLITLVAVPGMGKSRLIYELSRIVDAEPQLVTWRQGRCLAYGDGVAFWALAEMIKAQAGIQERDSEAETAEKLRNAVEAAVGDEGDARWVESHLRPLAGLETGTGLGGDRRGEAFAAWRRFLEALAEQRPLVLVFEDLHWADEGLLDFVDELVDWLTDVPVLVVGSARPELQERRPYWGGGKMNASTLSLAPLSPEQTARLIALVLERSMLPAEAQRALLERSGGNPLYAEQFAQLYVERGSAVDPRLPETLQGIVAARIDGLVPEEKAALQHAAVMGKVFWAGFVGTDRVETEPRLRSLERKGFLIRQRRSSLEGESEWAFAHMLLRDVAYAQIPRVERAAKHRAAAEWIERLGRHDDHAELLAHHWRLALELARAAGSETVELVGPTRLALREAGDRAYAVNAYPAAAAYYGGALELWPTNDEERPQLLHRLADALYVAGDERADSALEQAREALLASGERQAAANAELSLSRIWWERGQRERASKHQDHAAELAGTDASPTTARVVAFIARTRLVGGEPLEGLRLATEALAMAEALGIDELQAHALTTVGGAKDALDDPTGIRDIERALEIALTIDSPLAGTISNNVAVSAFRHFELRRGAELFDEGRRIAERFGDAAGARWLRGQQVFAAFVTGRWEHARRLADEFIAECEAGSSHYLEPHVRSQRARLREARGDIDGGLSDYSRALARAREAVDPQALLPQIGASVLALETRGLREESRALAVEMLDLSRRYVSEARFYLPWDFLLSHVAFEFEPEIRDVLNAASWSPWKDLSLTCIDRDFVGAAEIWAEGGSPTWEARARLRAAEELIASDHRPQGEQQASRALTLYRSVDAAYYVARCEAVVRGAKTAE